MSSKVFIIKGRESYLCNSWRRKVEKARHNIKSGNSFISVSILQTSSKFSDEWHADFFSSRNHGVCTWPLLA